MKIPQQGKWAAGTLTAVLLLFAVPCNAEETKSVDIILSDTGIQPGHIRSALDKPIHLHVVNRGQHLHQFSIPEFYIYSRTLQPGESSDITFAPYKTGRFPIISDPTGDNTPEFHGDITVLTIP